MDVKKIALLVGALVLAIISAFMAKSMFGNSGTPQATAAAPQPVVVDGPEILVATKALPVGTIIDPGSFRYQPWPKELMKNVYYIKGSADPASLAGTVVRYQITAGQPLTNGSLVKPGDRGFLAAALGPGMRAITVPIVNQSNGVAGFVFPGDRVDVMLTQDVRGGGDGDPLKTTETIVSNMRVLATDQRTDHKTDEQGNTQVVTYSNVTLEATPKIAEKIQVGQSIGQLSLALRSIADNTQELERAIASGEVSVPEGTDPKAEKSMLLAIASRPNDQNTTFTVGGEVSRFQRRTVPGKPKTDSTQGGAKPDGPSVRIARGNTVEFVPVGGK